MSAIARFKFISFSRAFSRGYSSFVQDDFLPVSTLPTYHFQNCLPRLPIPKLEDTMRRYLDSVTAQTGHPDVSDSDVEATKRAVNMFMMSEGPKLNQLLIEEDAANWDTSYICTALWDTYLKDRHPLPIFYNPFMILKSDPNPAMNNQLVKVTNIIISSLRFFKSLKCEVLSPDVSYTKPTAKSPVIQNVVKFLPNTFNLRYLAMHASAAYPLEMSLYSNLFSTTRIPQIGRDKIKTFENSTHVIIIRNGNFYTLDVLDESFNILSEEKIMQGINYILQEKALKPEHEIGYLTTEERDKWASTRSHLLNIGNADSIHAIESGLFCIVLEDAECDVADIPQSTKIFFLGDGGSRWFDKSLTLIVSRNGEACFSIEHSGLDGTTVGRYMDEIYQDTVNSPRVKSPKVLESVYSSPQVRKLGFTFDECTKVAISAAKNRYIADASRVNIAGRRYTLMSKEYLKNKMVSPDGVMQLAIQIGHRRMYRHPVVTLENSSTTAFKRGRTETVRSCTVESQAAAKFFSENGLNNVTNLQEASRLIRASCRKHNQLKSEAAQGLGYDRHMLALKNLALRQGLKTANIFEDKIYKLMMHDVLWAGTLGTESIVYTGLFPLVAEGIVISYVCRKDHLRWNATTFEKDDVAGLVEAITESFDDIWKVLESE